MADLNSSCDKCSNPARWRCRKATESQVRRLCGSCFLALMSEEELLDVQPLKAPWHPPTAQPVRTVNSQAVNSSPLASSPYPLLRFDFSRILDCLPAEGTVEIEDLFAWLLAEGDSEEVNSA